MRALDFAFISIFFAAAALPSANRLFPLVPEVPLSGVVTMRSEVPFTTRSYLSGEFQGAFEQRFDAKLGFRGHLVRTDNELNVRAFSQIGNDPSTSAILGRNDFIYDREYLNAINRRDLVPVFRLEQKVKRLKLVQDYLARRGSAFVVVISANKVFLYPEYVPERYLDPRRLEGPTNYATFADLLKRYEVNFIDSNAQLSALKPSSKFTLFANTGMHWTMAAACEVTARLVASLAGQLHKKLSALRCGPYRALDVPSAGDRDTLEVSNLLFPERLYRPTASVRSRVVRQRGVERPSVLLIGSSFVWAILDHLDKNRITHNTFFRYYSTQHVRSSAKKIDPAALDWNQEVFSKQAIVIETNISGVQDVGWGFLEDAERFIMKNP